MFRTTEAGGDLVLMAGPLMLRRGRLRHHRSPPVGIAGRSNGAVARRNAV